MTHLPSCHVSRNWRGEKATFAVIPSKETDEDLLREFGFSQASLCWYAELTLDQADKLKPRLRCSDFSPECYCYNPTMSEKENQDFNRARATRELEEGWPPGKPDK